MHGTFVWNELATASKNLLKPKQSRWVPDSRLCQSLAVPW